MTDPYSHIPTGIYATPKGRKVASVVAAVMAVFVLIWIWRQHGT